MDSQNWAQQYEKEAQHEHSAGREKNKRIKIIAVVSFFYLFYNELNVFSYYWYVC